ncbi:hypothetical protein M0R72_13620 [Candidatus Pacearchaeota archaeon]|nr:hypothetical protein [Candidatus Pacearchaeota archaeon]
MGKKTLFHFEEDYTDAISRIKKQDTAIDRKDKALRELADAAERFRKAAIVLAADYLLLFEHDPDSTTVAGFTLGQWRKGAIEARSIDSAVIDARKEAGT